MKRSELEKIIREEIQNVFAELDMMNEFLEERKKRAPYGKKYRTPDAKTASYYSAGSVPDKHGRKLGPGGAAKREEIGKKILNAMRRGKNDPQARKLQRNIKGRAIKKLGKNPSQEEILSFVWALASDMVAKGKSDWRDMVKEINNPSDSENM
jgi:hypothetical protein